MFVERRLDKPRKSIVLSNKIWYSRSCKGIGLISRGCFFVRCGFLEDRDIKSKLSFLVLSIAVVIVCISAPQVHADIQDGLISYWPLDKGAGTTAEDMVGSNDGTIHGGAGWVTGKFGSALSFDGVGANVNCGTDASLRPTTGISLSAWVKYDALNYYGSIMSNQHWTGDNRSGYSIHNNGSTLYFCMAATNTGVFTWATNGTPIAVGTWYHVAATYDGTTMRIYMDGVQEGTASAPGSIDYNPLPNTGFGIGMWHDNDGEQYYLDGIIDDVGVWGRALTTQEIDFLYNGGSGNPVTSVLYVYVTESEGETVVKEGEFGDSYEVVLGSEPSQEVQITATPSDGQIDLGAGAGVPIILTFTTENWDTPKTVNVSAYDDDIYEGKEPHVVTISHSANGGDYTGINISSVEVEVIDDELICGDWGYMRGDINKDCYVDLLDFAEFASQWMSSEPQ